MGYKVILAAILVAALAGTYVLADDVGSHGEIPWIDNIGSALSTAEKSGRPAMVDIWAVWCVPCKEMDKTTYVDPNVVRGAERFVPLKVDADVKTSFIERYDVDAYPTLLFLDGDGREITRWRGAIDAATLSGLMDKVLAGYDDHLALRKQTDDPEAVRRLADYYLSVGNGDAAMGHLRASLKALKGAGAEVREPLELRLAEAQVASGSLKAACKTYTKLADGAEVEEVRGKALLGLARVERERGNEDEAGATLDRLRAEYPDLAESAGL
jgi:thioredoxin-like negative regulator of GroEL